jgi:hypothetical protein
MNERGTEHARTHAHTHAHAQEAYRKWIQIAASQSVRDRVFSTRYRDAEFLPDPAEALADAVADAGPPPPSSAASLTCAANRLKELSSPLI